MDNKLNYQKAARIRGQSLASVFADQLILGEGYGSGLKKAIGLKTQAKVKGIKEKFDPLNVAKFLTGGSRLGPALLGKMTGRSRKDIEYFTGRASPISNRGPKISGLPSTGGEGGDLSGVTGILKEIITFLKESRDEDKKLREKENNFAESRKLEDDRRHNELLKALGVNVPTATKVKQEKSGSFFDSLMDAFGMGKDFLNILRVVGPLLANPLVLGLIGAVAIGAGLTYLIVTDKNPEETSKGLLKAYEPGGLSESIIAASEDVVASRKNQILSERTGEDWSLNPFKDPELQEKYLKKIGWDEKSATTKAERDSGIIGFDSDGQPMRKKIAMPDQTDAETNRLNRLGNPNAQTSTPTATPIPTLGDIEKANSTVNKATPMAAPETPTPKSASLDSMSRENNTLNMEDKVSQAVQETKTNTILSDKKRNVKPLAGVPSARNTEDTFQRMILNSTRIV